MKKIDLQEFSEVFHNIGITKGDTLLIHNSLLKFGIPSDIKLSEFPSEIFQIINDFIGIEGTIAVPTFNFDFCKGIPFNRQETPSKNMGVFSEFVRKLSDAKRSYHPMQSIAVVGSQTDSIIENDTESAFSPMGPFDKLKDLNGKILLLGADFNSISMIHWVEEKLKVPYRYWKNFSGTYVDNGYISEKSYKMFVRSLDTNPILKLYSIEEELKRENKLKREKIGGGIISVFDIADFLQVAESFLVDNSYFFVSNHPMFEKL